MTKGMVIRGKKQGNAIREHEVRFLRFEKSVMTKITALTGCSALAAIAGWQLLLDKVGAGVQDFADATGVRAGNVAGLQDMYGQLGDALTGLRVAVANGGDVLQQTEALAFQIATIHEQLTAVLPEWYQPLVKGSDDKTSNDTIRSLLAVVTG